MKNIKLDPKALLGLRLVDDNSLKISSKIGSKSPKISSKVGEKSPKR